MAVNPILTGPILRQYRNALGLKQGEIGEQLGISQAAVSLMEAGRMALSDNLSKLIVDRFNRSGISPRLSEFLAQLEREAPPHLTRSVHVTLPIFRWSSQSDPRDMPSDPPVDLITLRWSTPAIALSMKSATTAWEKGEILVFTVCEPSDCKPGDLVLLVPNHHRRNAVSVIAGVERLKGRSSAHRRFLPIQPSAPALPANAESVLFTARCVYRARYIGTMDR